MDYMPVATQANGPELARQLIRHVKVTRGTMTFRIECSGGEGTFSLCTFWLVEALTPAGRIAEARFVFEQMLSVAEHLGLYAEEIGPSGEALGNFPQAFTHLTLISSAFNLDRVLGAGR